MVYSSPSSLTLGSAVLAGDDLVARLDFHLHFVAVHHSAGADDDDFVNFRLLLRRAREDDAALGLFLGFRPLEDNATANGLRFMVSPPMIILIFILLI